MKKILVISPHADDEVLGCGGYLMREIENGANVLVLFCTIGGVNENQNTKSRLEEADNVARYIGYDYEVLFYGKDAQLDTIPSLEITRLIDEKIFEFEPDEVLVNYPSKHQDHIKVYECANASMRIKPTHMPSLFALYEYPFISQQDRINGGAMYCDVTKYIDRKVDAFNLYKSQVKDFPSPLNDRGIKSLAQMRGLESGVGYAELFYIQRLNLI